MAAFPLQETLIQPGFASAAAFQHFPAAAFPTIHPIHWLHSHFAVGGWSPLQRLSGMLTAHMTRIAPQAGFTWHPHRGLEIYTWMLEGRLYHEDTTGGKGELHPGDLQRMFSGDWIEHQELNPYDEPARVIQIWFIADRQHRGLEPHYQQLSRAQLPVRQVGDARVYSLIGDDAPMQQHMTGRLTAGALAANGSSVVEAPRTGEELFLYVTDGAGTVTYDGERLPLAQYDVLLTAPDRAQAVLRAGERGLDYLSFYLPPFLPEAPTP
jgi:redox-sensitive bicupin YhaK (pirin superfamily)